jgi:hypothetical protein
MTYRIVIPSDIKHQIQALPGHIKLIARQRIADLSANPRHRAAKSLKGISATIAYTLPRTIDWCGW